MQTSLVPARGNASRIAARRGIGPALVGLWRRLIANFGRPNALAGAVGNDDVPPAALVTSLPQLIAAGAEVEALRREADWLRCQATFYRSIFECSSDAIVVADLNGTITMFNQGAVEIFQLDADLAIGDNLFRLCTESCRPSGHELAQLLVRNKLIRSLRTEFMGLKGKTTPVLLTLNFVTGGNGTPTAIVAVIKDNSEVEKLTYIDPLTGLYNVRYFQRKINEEYSRLSRGQMDALSMLFLDLDFFGEFNKVYGHQVGDEVLRRVAEVLQTAVRCADTAARYGGEEFVVILPSTDEGGSLHLAERIRQRVADIRIPVEGRPDIRVTVSIGSKTHTPKDNSTVTLFIRQANMAMLKAKQCGRNRVVNG